MAFPWAVQYQVRMVILTEDIDSKIGKIQLLGVLSLKVWHRVVLCDSFGRVLPPYSFSKCDHVFKFLIIFMFVPSRLVCFGI